MSDEIYYDSNNYGSANGDAPENPKSGSVGFAVTSLVLSIVNIVCCFFSLSFILVPLSLIFGIISLATHRGGKGMAIAGVIISGLTLALIVIGGVVYAEPIKDYVKFMQNYDYYVAEYDRTHEIPDEFMKYTDPKYDEVWEQMEMSGFGEFYEYMIDQFKAQSGTSSSGSDVVDLSFKPVLSPA